VVKPTNSQLMIHMGMEFVAAMEMVVIV